MEQMGRIAWERSGLCAKSYPVPWNSFAVADCGRFVFQTRSGGLQSQKLTFELGQTTTMKGRILIKRKIGTLFIAMFTLCSLSVSVFALEPIIPLHPISEPELGEPVQIINYIDENGNNVIEKIYFSPEPGSEGISVLANGEVAVAAETSGRGWYQKEKYILRKH